MTPIISVKDVRRSYGRGQNRFEALKGVSFDIFEGETLGVVGESGCGKSTAGRAVLRLYEATAGSIRIDGEDIATLPPEKLRRKRPSMQMVFQDPQASLNPRMTVAGIIGEPLDEHTDWSRAKKLERIYELMDQVGLNRDFANRYPHAFSGGQRQRIGIARALALKPKFIVCDEPIAALDVSIQAQVVNLLRDLQREMGLTLIFVAHDIGIVRHISDEVLVMYLGGMMEYGPAREVVTAPRHPYTRALLSAVPVPDPDVKVIPQILQGDLPSPMDLPKGCFFQSRCVHATQACGETRPQIRAIGASHVSCIRAEELETA